MSDDETLFFIDQIFRRKSLWDRKDKGYKNIIVKADMWNEIAGVMQHPVQTLKDKWTSLQATYRKYRSNYNRSFVTGSGADEIALPTWCGYSAMRFLDSTTECGMTLNTLPDLEIEMLDEANELQYLDGPSSENVPEHSLLPELDGTTAPEPRPSHASPTRHTTVPRASSPPHNRRRRYQEGSIAYTEEALEALKTVGTATIELINKLNTPSDELDGVRETIKEWTPERRKRFLVRVRRMVTEEEDIRFRQNFGYQA
ncbi:uncharacterized protein LOC125769398 [Anopheles funestus]|uniref:uncharacterized protein LOC125769398 n=1 Tax=Anopheles funestus TaxID=62324 RepID=UPI0020C61590|nr:uncharacterized protein LOC125769398 [Anopheles funestus]